MVDPNKIPPYSNSHMGDLLGAEIETVSRRGRKEEEGGRESKAFIGSVMHAQRDV